MPAIDDYKAHLYRADYSLVFLVAAVIVCVLITIRLWRKAPRFRANIDLVPYLWWFLALPASVLIASAGWWSQFVALHIPLPTRLQYRPSVRHVVFLALLLRLPVMFQAFWYDEAFTERLTTLALPQLWPAILSDTHPPLYYTSIYLWSKVFGHSEFMLRVPSLLLGLLIVFLLYRLVLAIGLSPRAALLAAFLCAITPSAIYYSAEARNYAALTCAVIGALRCIFEDRPRWFVVCVALCAWLHNLGLFYVPVLIGAALLMHGGVLRYSLDLLFRRYPNRWLSNDNFAETLQGVRRELKIWRLSCVLAIAISMVWLPLTIQQSKSISDGFWIYFNAGTPFWTLSLNLMYLPREYILPVMLPYIALTLFAFWISRHWLRTATGAALLIVMIGAPALTILASMFWAPVFLPRIFLPVTLLGLIPLAYALDTRWRIVASVALPVLLTSLLVFYSASTLLRPDFRPMVAEGCQGATAMFYTALDTAITIAPYWPGKALVWNAGTDRGLTFKPDQMPLFNFEDGDVSALAGEKVCVFYIFTPRTLQSERDEVASLLSAYPHTSREYDVHSELQVDVYVLDVKGKAS